MAYSAYPPAQQAAYGGPPTFPDPAQHVYREGPGYYAQPQPNMSQHAGYSNIEQPNHSSTAAYPVPYGPTGGPNAAPGSAYNNGYSAAPTSPNPANHQVYGYTDADIEENRRFSKKWRRRLMWMVPLAILALVLVILFEVYKSDFERWVQPLTNWLQARKSWSWVIPVAILIILSIPPLFGHEIVQLIVGLTFSLGIGIGIAIAGAILGEALCFILFKYGFSGWVQRKREQKVNWEATARVANEAGFWGILLIRYSIVPPHLANPIFATTGMSFFVYMATVVLSLPKTIVFVALGTPSNSGKTGVKAAKVIAVGVLVVVTLYATWWIRKRMNRAKDEIYAERGGKAAAKAAEAARKNGSKA